VDGSKGLGFAAISPSLENSIDTLTRLQPPEFKLFKVNVPDSVLYEKREGFSEVGRTVGGGFSIVFCKTADGAIDVSERPHPVVHALMADVKTLGLLSASRIREGFWIRKTDQQTLARLQLTDSDLAEIIDPTIVTPIPHQCPAGHEEAVEFLKSLTGVREGTYNIDVASFPDAFSTLLIAFPQSVVEGFCHAPYVSLTGVEHEIALRLPQAFPTGAVDNCPLRGAALASARKYLYGSDASIGRYAESVLRATDTLPPRSAATRSAPGQRAADAADGSTPPGPSTFLRERMQSVRDTTEAVDNRPFDDKQSAALLEKLRQSGDQREVLGADKSLLLDAFGQVSDGNVIRRWNQAWVDVDINTFIELWNTTHVSAFLGIVLLKNLPARELSSKISADRGSSPQATEQMLRSMENERGGGASIGFAIRAGLGNAESMRSFICGVFSESPKYLYDTILETADLPKDQVIDYIRFGFQSWAAHRGLSIGESSALQELLKPKFYDRIKSIFGK
jgi:hypothetical protein